MIDFTPCVGYGELIDVPPQTTVYVVLYPLPDYAADAEFLVESEEETNIFLERLVGTVHLSWDGMAVPSNGQVGWRLMPLGVNYDTLEVLEPFSVPFFPSSSEWCNLKWWYERLRQVAFAGAAQLAPNVSDHPYWTTVDCKPKMMLGAGRNLWPVLAIRNDSAGVEEITLTLRHRLRALWKY